MTEKESFLNTWAREHATTVKILKQLPADKADFTPTKEKTKSAKSLAEVFIAELGLIADGVVKGQIDFTVQTPKFSSYADVLQGYEQAYNATAARIKAMPEAEWNATMAFPTGPKQMSQLRKGDILWTMLMDSIHHRGQFSVYLRLVGAKVPSIYGPSADEPWM